MHFGHVQFVNAQKNLEPQVAHPNHGSNVTYCKAVLEFWSWHNFSCLSHYHLVTSLVSIPFPPSLSLSSPSVWCSTPLSSSPWDSARQQQLNYKKFSVCFDLTNKHWTLAFAFVTGCSDADFYVKVTPFVCIQAASLYWISIYCWDSNFSDLVI